MKIKVSEATPLQIDWLVTFALYGEQAHYIYKHNPGSHRYSTSWERGGPIIERCITKLEDYGDCWGAEGPDAPEQYGPPMLIAAMRCFVASRLGETVEVPEELA